MAARRADAVVVGGGPGGLAAATWLARYRRSVVVLDGGEYRNRWVEMVHGYLGYDPASPDALLEHARRQLAVYDETEIRRTNAGAVRRTADGFAVETGDGAIAARRLVLATGVEDRFPHIEGFLEHYGADVFHCPTCDGYEARDREVVVLGWSEDVGAFAIGLLNWARRVTIVTGGLRFEGDEGRRDSLARRGIEILEREATELLGLRGALEGVRLDDGAVLPCTVVFFSLGHRPRAELAVSLGCDVTEGGYVTVDREGRTSVPGVFAAGDVTPGTQLVQLAAAQGAAAGIACARSLLEEEL